MPEVLQSGGCYDRYRCPSVQCSGLKPQKHLQGSRKNQTLCDSLYRPWWGGSYIKSVTVTCHKLYFECGFLCCTILLGPPPNNGAIRTMRCMGKITLEPPTPLKYMTPYHSRRARKGVGFAPIDLGILRWQVGETNYNSYARQ